MHRLLEDSDLEGGQGVTVDQVQALLENEGSALAGYVEGGKSAAAWIVTESEAADISPVYMVARIETESGLIRSGTLANLSSATGCACPDGSPCDPAVAGFGLQVQCAAELVRGYLSDLDDFNETISGWGVDFGRWTLDPCWVVPETRATAALYTYTPWVGAYAPECGTSQWGGSSLVAVLVHDFAAALPEKGSACPFGDGYYCGGNDVGGEESSLYLCSGGELSLAEVCDVACETADPGFNDACSSSCPFGDGYYCGGNGIAGDANSLYWCGDGSTTLVEQCASGCQAMDPGEHDACK